jgi:hypothetical protein
MLLIILKRSLLALLLTVAITSLGTAQKVRVGVKAGPQATYLSGADGLTIKVGYHAGAVLRIKPAEQWALQPEALYSVMGAGTDDGDNNGLRLVYVQVPLLLKWYPLDNFYLAGGPQPGLLLESLIRERGGIEDPNQTFRKVDLGASAGLGYEFGGRVDLGLRYTYGLLDVNMSAARDRNWHNQSLQFSLAFLF